MRAVLVDPYILKHALMDGGDTTGIVRPVEHDGGIRDIYDHLAPPGQTVESFECIRHDSYPDCLYVDQDGLKGQADAWFTFYRYPHPLAGRGLLCHIDSHGDNAPPKMSLEEARQNVMVGYKGHEWTAAHGIRKLGGDVLRQWQDKHRWLNLSHIRARKCG